MAKSNRETFEKTYDGAQEQPLLPPTRGDPAAGPSIPSSLEQFRKQEGDKRREDRLRLIFRAISGEAQQHQQHQQERPQNTDKASQSTPSKLSETDRAKRLLDLYRAELFKQLALDGNDELAANANESIPSAQEQLEKHLQNLEWTHFLSYVEKKEEELWKVFHDQLDLDGNGHLDARELRTALSNAGIELHPSTIIEFMTFLTQSPHSHTISFREFRDFLILMPRAVSTEEIYRFYETRKQLNSDEMRVNMEGDVSLNAVEDLFYDHHKHAPTHFDPSFTPRLDHADDQGHHQESATQSEHQNHVSTNQAVKFLLAGGIAGAVSRTATAPFDRLKVFLITRPTEVNPLSAGTLLHPQKSARALWGAVVRLYAESGVTGFWIGNGLNIAKIMPESAIKFFSYESSKRMFARYVDMVDDPREISGTSRFISGGIGGLTSQLSIYPIETVKTRMMSETSATHILPTVRQMWAQGGMRTFYRGLVIGLVGVFPYSAIDMSTFEALKLAYLKSIKKEDPGVLATLAFGSISGSVGATSVYPLNLIRTRLQASGSSGHPQVYTGMWDVTQQTYYKEGYRGFYKGLVPTLAKVVPAVSISYVVYESAKKSLGV